MANIMDYINFRGDLKFDFSPFNSVDNLILARLAYIDFDDLKDGYEILESIANRYENMEEKWDPDRPVTDEARPLLNAVGDSERFGGLLLKNFINIIDEKKELQFSAVTFEIDERTAYIAFRGTDDTLIGWKEDLNMIYLDSIPAQIKAKEYLEETLKHNSYSNVYVGGHSKGGNLAVYAAVNIVGKYQSLIKGVYNNDGPGFKDDQDAKPEYQKISERIHTLIPQNSIVGLFLEYDSKYRIIKTSQPDKLEHNTFTWIANGIDFEYIEDFSDHVKILDMATRETLLNMTAEQRKAFTDVVFLVLSVNDSKKISDLDKGGIASIIEASKKFDALDENTKAVVDEVVTNFLSKGYKSYLQVTEHDRWKNRLKNWAEETNDEITKFLKEL